MIYTIGLTESYLSYFADQGRPRKKGRSGFYPGGSVWQTREAAEEHCPRGYSVFGVLAEWGTQTAPSLVGDWHDLLVDADLVLLGERP